MSKQNHKIEPEFGVESRYNDENEKNSEAIKLMEKRLAKMKELPKEQVTKARLYQVKFQMEEFLGSNNFDLSFSKILAKYVDSVYEQRKDFAQDIGISSISISHVINEHREPNEEFLMKLMIHSEQVFEKFCDFKKELWSEIFLHGKMLKTLRKLEEQRDELQKSVKVSKKLVA